MAGDYALILTPPGPAGIAVIRLAGPSVGAFFRNHFSKPLRENTCVYGTLSDGDRVIDDAVIVLSGGGTIADVNLHGGPWIVHRAVELARAGGFSLISSAPSQPLPDLAVDAQDPLEREILTHLPLARTELAIRALLAQEQAWRTLLAGPRPTRAQVDAILADRALHWLLHPPRIAIIGAPNVGKSTLANQLFARERSITADLPGTTRDWVADFANLDGLAVHLIDTPGLRVATDPIEGQAIQHSLEPIRRADLRLLVLDASAPLDGPPADLLRQYPDALVIVNKADLPPAFPPPAGALSTVATTGAGVDPLRAVLLAHFQCHKLSPDCPRCWTARQETVLKELADV